MEFIGLPIYQDEFDFRFCDIYSINDTTFENINSSINNEFTIKKCDIDNL